MASVSKPTVLAAGLLTGLTMVGPVSAQDGACAPVLAALQGMGGAPRYHWTMAAKTPTRRRPFEREQIVFDDVVYLTPDQGRWMKQQMPQSDRAARMSEELARNPIGECRLISTESVGGAAMRVYTYVQGGEGTRYTKRIWIGEVDNLPHAFAAIQGPVSVTMKVDYQGVEAPLP
jgi:hypothetical protein